MNHELKQRCEKMDPPIADTADPVLCCCEYINSKGEKAHLLGLLCDCSEVDDFFDRLVKGAPVPASRPSEIMSTVEDRLRIPWVGGAMKVRLDVALPWLLVPLNLWASSLSLTSLLVVHGAIMPLEVYLTYRFCVRSRLRPQTKFFASWSAATTFYLFCIYQYQVVGLAALPKIISPWENLCLITFLMGAFYAAYSVKQRATFTDNAAAATDNPTAHAAAPGVRNNNQAFATRYCSVCTTTVPHKEHHCVWLDACVYLGNFYPFVAFLFCILVTLLHSGLLFLTSVCDSVREFSLWSGGRLVVLVPTNCWAFNHRFDGDPGLVFAAGIHCLCLSIPISLMLIHKVYVALSSADFQLSWKGYRKRAYY